MSGVFLKSLSVSYRILIEIAAVFAAIAGVAITRVGYFTAFLALGSAVFLIGSGLTYTLQIGSSSSKYLGYQVLLGLGQGLAIQIPVIVGQAFSMMEDIASVTAIVLCKVSLPSPLSVTNIISSFPNDGRGSIYSSR